MIIISVEVSVTFLVIETNFTLMFLKKYTYIFPKNYCLNCLSYDKIQMHKREKEKQD